MKDKIKRAIAAVAALGALALGGAAIAGATAGGDSNASAPVAGTEAGESAEAEGPEGTESEEFGAGESEDEQTLNGPEAEQARQAAEQATGGTAGDVERDNAESEKGEEADDDGGSEQGYQSPANAAYEVEVTNDGSEVEVYLDSNFQVLDTQADDEQ